MTLITLYDNTHPIAYSEDMIDEWFRSLTPAEKVRLFWMEHEEIRSDLGEFVDEAFANRQSLNPVADFVAKLDAAEKIALAAPTRPSLPAPVVDMAGPQVGLLHPCGSWDRISLFDAARLTDAGAIAERTSYSDDQFDGSDVSQYFEVVNAEALVREMSL